MKQPAEEPPAPDAQAIEAARAAVCRQPNAPQREALSRLMSSVLPSAADGTLIDIPPGVELPEGAKAAERPDLYSGAEWVAGTYCRCWPESCAKTRPAPELNPAPSAEEPAP